MTVRIRVTMKAPIPGRPFVLRRGESMFEVLQEPTVTPQKRKRKKPRY